MKSAKRRFGSSFNIFRAGEKCIISKVISHVTISNPMSNPDNHYGCTLDSAGELSIKSIK